MITKGIRQFIFDDLIDVRYTMELKKKKAMILVSEREFIQMRII